MAGRHSYFFWPCTKVALTAAQQPLAYRIHSMMRCGFSHIFRKYAMKKNEGENLCKYILSYSYCTHLCISENYIYIPGTQMTSIFEGQASNQNKGPHLGSRYIIFKNRGTTTSWPSCHFPCRGQSAWSRRGQRVQRSTVHGSGGAPSWSL